MSTFNVCSYCVRTLRQSIQLEARASRAQSQRVSSRRYLSTTSPRWQQPALQKDDELFPERPVVPPTTASTITTNVTAAPPPSNEFEGQPPSQPAGQAFPPTTASTVTSNITASPAPEAVDTKDKSSSAVPPTPGPASTAQMQRQIKSSLSSTKPSALNIPARVAQSLQKNVPAVTKTYTIYGETEALFKSCAAAADYTIPQDQRMNILTGKGPVKETSQGGAEVGQPLHPQNWWFKEMGLPATFSTWSQVTFLHMYVIVTHLRAVLESEAEFQNYHRYLIEQFSREAEDKMILLHNMSAQGIRSRYLKDFLLQWRGILLSYDEGLVKGDAVLASAIWRNLFRADEDVDWVKVAQVVAFLRLSVRKIGFRSMQEVVGDLTVKENIWPNVEGGISTLVDRPTQGIRAPLEA
ncbi:Serine carboxypeptidase 3 [Cladophialophora chaetospira]|uniref:Serine carboxypeptidase 3 n=1 Tax=Cladophialophora chaetospira TaxID=386627 RepID=A0AA39CMX6_9EURO|nr:Serine carboxypeptidase 3 [Cladophialophora chaetospira]